MKAIEKFFESKGFRPTYCPTPNTPCFEGTMDVLGHEIRLEFRFKNLLYGFPEVALVDWPHESNLKKILGFCHIDSKGIICHADESQMWWDASLSDRFTSSVFNTVKQILLDNIRGRCSRNYFRRDIAGYWNPDHTVYLSDLPQNRRPLVSLKHQKGTWLTSESNPLKWLSECSDFEHKEYWLPFQINNLPQPIDSWPPCTISQTLKWLESENQNINEQLFAAIYFSFFEKKIKRKRKATPLIINILIGLNDEKNHLEFLIGFSFRIDSNIRNIFTNSRYRKADKIIKKLNIPIRRFATKKADLSYLHSRNLSSNQSTLLNKIIIIVGLGAIGGFLAQQLCFLGAGSGRRGKILLIDPDSLEPENISRHFLGMNYIGQSKVESMNIELKQRFPHIEIEPVESSIWPHLKKLKGSDLVINATGDQGSSIGLEKYLSGLDKRPSILHSSIYGQGLATIAFFNDGSKKSACYRCLWTLTNTDIYQRRYSITSNPALEEPVKVGCHSSFHPYACTAAIQAATQSTNVIIEWLNGVLENTLQHQIIRHDLCQNRGNATPIKHKECPICFPKAET